MNICLYGASSPALDRAYFDAAEEFGRLLDAELRRSIRSSARSLPHGQARPAATRAEKSPASRRTF